MQPSCHHLVGFFRVSLHMLCDSVQFLPFRQPLTSLLGLGPPRWQTKYKFELRSPKRFQPRHAVAGRLPQCLLQISTSGWLFGQRPAFRGTLGVSRDDDHGCITCMNLRTMAQPRNCTWPSFSKRISWQLECVGRNMSPLSLFSNSAFWSPNRAQATRNRTRNRRS